MLEKGWASKNTDEILEGVLTKLDQHTVRGSNTALDTMDQERSGHSPDRGGPNPAGPESLDASIQSLEDRGSPATHRLLGQQQA